MALERRKRRHLQFWRVINPPTRYLAGIVPWWVLLETKGRRSGLLRTVPLASGPMEPDGMWLNAVHGRHADWVLNVEANPRVRLRLRRQWRGGTAEIHPMDPTLLRRFSRYARGGPAIFGIDPLQVFVRWTAATNDNAGAGQSASG